MSSNDFKIGDVSAITISTRDLQESKAFYYLLGFSEVASNIIPVPWVLITDGSLPKHFRQMIFLNPVNIRIR